MCGLSGEIRFDGGRPDLAAVERMSDRLAARGPDGQGIWTRGAVALSPAPAATGSSSNSPDSRI
ncbi:hypothetical protein, partial [Streptomyces griseorubiginosus]|uniref:hypothetical protein n=1 Tax=Streptomyces griseorubiginosus TaxID=67304 RepID=UPI0033F5EC6F